jgi:hypothetical protein
LQWSRTTTGAQGAIEKQVTIATETVLKNKKMISIFHRIAAHAFLNDGNISTSYHSVPDPSP